MDLQRSRRYRRVAQACETCRRKKIRCPGERPRCSACTRLDQQCSFAQDDHIDPHTANLIEGRMANRIVQLEGKLDNLLNRLQPQLTQQTTPTSPSGGISDIIDGSTTTTHHSPLSASTSAGGPLPAEIITRAIDLYFRHIHRQPLWLFDQESLPGPDTCDELIYVILALGLNYDIMEFSDASMKTPEVYSNTARRLIMLRIADGNMSLQSTQALSGDVAVAGFHLALAKNVMQHAVLQQDGPHASGTSHEQSKLFWSIHLLTAFYGAPDLVPHIPNDISDPHYSVTETRRTLTACPPLPLYPSTLRPNNLPDIWSQSVKLCSLWRDVRLYVSSCIEGIAKQPWQPDSGYTRLCSSLLEVEISHPTSLSYNAVNFSALPMEDIQRDRSSFLPWLRVQVTYHTIHCVLNHPFLYSSMADPPRQRLGAGTFWRGSYEKALRHCTWVSRLIRLASEKGLLLADPFFAQAAAIASTLHLYWTRSSDNQLKISSLENLSICRTLITTMARHWPEHSLEEFEDLVNPLANSSDPESNRTVAKISLIWILLDMAAPQFPSYSGDSTRGRNGWGIWGGSEDIPVLQRSQTNTPPTDVRESTAHYASPPPWLISEPIRTGIPAGIENVQENTESSLHGVVPGQHGITGDLAWGAWEDLVPMGETTMVDINWWEL
ncbi:hypothetical protein VTL71DRAFT_6742 [Oculimacula yallundae]|uniref:Zn(2)-C6 fungal-type domain-containing protein n=1 Tax=Oculimacula yallundae TaxID=86028 RepID=A0ABR4BZD2_9HELO